MRLNLWSAVPVMVASGVLLTGCNLNSSNGGLAPAPAPPTTTSAPTPPTSTPRISHPSIFVTANDYPTASVVVLKPDGETTLRFAGFQPAVDGAGNIYVLSCVLGFQNCTSPSINIYSPDPFQIVRSLPVGPGTKIQDVHDMTVSAAGEIFVNDGSRIAVFSPTADGNVDPVRHIDGHFDPAMTVDGAGNLYVPFNEGIAVFGPKDAGTGAPSRVLNVQGGWLATDSQGNLYVLGYGERNDGLNPFGVTEYAAMASGHAVPLRYITSPGMGTTGWDDSPGIAVDTNGTIYVSATFQSGGSGVWEFAADASGSATPLKTLTWSGGQNNGGIAVH